MTSPETVFDKALAIAKRYRNLETAIPILTQAGILSFGIEHVQCGSRRLSYINLGDTYGTTICEESGGVFFIGSWGGWHEETEQQQNEEDGTITCGRCSHKTPMNKDDWHDVICVSCGHRVDGGYRRWN